MFSADGSGTRFEHATSLAAALETTPERFDAALLDLGLPDAVGLEALLAFRRDVPSLPVVVLTGHDDPGLASQAIQAGAQDYVVKGDADPKLLLRVLRYSIERSSTEQEARESERRYRDLFESSPLPMWVHDIDSSHFLAVNEAALNAYGYSRDEFLRMTRRDLPSGDVTDLGSFLGIGRAQPQFHRPPSAQGRQPPRRPHHQPRPEFRRPRCAARACPRT